MGASTSSLGTMNNPAAAALSVFHLLGINSMYGLVYRNGYIQALFDLKNHGPHYLPGSTNPILTCFTGISPLDKLLTLAGVMFANVTDGSAPQLSLYGFHFAGQLVSIFMVMIIEALREGNEGGPISLYPLWGCAMQGLGYGFAMPIWCIVHLLRSSTSGDLNRELAKAIQIRDLTSLETLPMSFVLGYFIPTVLMAIPVPSNNLHQWLGGLWQGFPVWVALTQIILGAVRRYLEKGSPPKTRLENRYQLYHAYLFAFTATCVSHLGTLGTIAARRLFPGLFSELAQETLTLKEVFLPPNFQNPGPMESMATGIHNFFQYDQYVGSIAALAWAVALKVNSKKAPMVWKDWAWLVAELIGVGAVAGPAGALVTLMWNRDETVLLDDSLYDSQ